MIPMTHGKGVFFDENCRKYRCCCKFLHVKTGTWVVAILGCAGVLYSLIASPYYVPIPLSQHGDPYSLDMEMPDRLHLHFEPSTRAPGVNASNQTDSKNYSMRLGGGTIFTIIDAVIVGCMLTGLALSQHQLLVPYLVCQLIRIGVIILCVSLLLLGGALFGEAILDFVLDVAAANRSLNATAETLNMLENMVKGLYVVVVIIMCLCCCIDIWLFTVVKGCYHYFKDRSLWLLDGVQQPPSSIQYIVTPDEK